LRNGRATRETIKRRALELFVARGVDGTGVRDIAKASGVTEGALYRHFTGKDDLVWRLFSEPYAAYAEKLDALQQGERGAAAKLRAMVAGFCAFFDDDEVLFRFLLLVQHGQLDKVDDAMTTPVQVVERVIRGGIDAGEIAAQDAAQATASVLGIVLQTATFHIYGRLTGPMRGRADALGRACLGALGIV